MGKDRRSNSATRGLISYVVKPGATAGQTQVDVNIGFTLTGALAQFNRSGLVQDVAGRIIAVFVQNLETRLSHGGAGGAETQPKMVTELDAGSLIRSVVTDYLRRTFKRLLGRS
jgi:carbon-monoxide dehydrogenase small subunit